MNTFTRLRNQPLRRTDDGYLGGVCAGLSHRWNISPILLRIAFFIACFFGGLGVIAYGVAWLLIPHDPDNHIELENAVEGRVSGGFAASIGVIAVGLWISFQEWHHHAFFFSGFASTLFTVIVITILVILLLRKNHQPSELHTSPEFHTSENTMAYESTSASPTPEPIPVRTPRLRVPALSGAFILLTSALAATSAALLMLFLPRTMASALIVLGTALGILGLGIAWAGLRKRRSTWLSFVATLLAFPVITLILLSFVAPAKLMNDPHARFFSNSSTSSSGVVDNTTRYVDQLPDNTDISGIIGDSTFVVDRTNAVVLDITITGNISMNDLGGWKISTDNSSFTTETPFLHSRTTDEMKTHIKPDEKIDMHDWYVDRNFNPELGSNRTIQKHVTITSPAALENPGHARRIAINYAVGAVRIAETLNGKDDAAFIIEQLKKTPSESK